MGDMPSVEDVYSKVKGSDPVDTAARQVGALRQLSGIVRALSAGGDLGNSVTPEEQQLSAKYISASQEVDRRGLALVASSSTTTVGPNAPAPTWFRARMNYDTEAYRDELLGLFSPRLKAIYQSRFGTFAARKAGFREQAAAAEKADRDRKAEWALERQRADEAATGEETARADAKKLADASDVQMANDSAKAKAKGTDMSIFGAFRIAEPLSLPKCANGSSSRSFCIVSDELVAFPLKMVPAWVAYDGAGIVIRGKTLVSVHFPQVRGDDGLRRDLVKKYGRPRRETPISFSNAFGKSTKGSNLEWELPGLHVEFTLHETQGNDDLLGELLVEAESAYKERRTCEGEEEAQRRPL